MPAKHCGSMSEADIESLINERDYYKARYENLHRRRFDQRKVVSLRAQGLSLRQIAKRMNMARSTVWKIIHEDAIIQQHDAR